MWTLALRCGSTGVLKQQWTVMAMKNLTSMSELRLQGRLWHVSVVQMSSLWCRKCHSFLHGCSPALGKETRASRKIWGRRPAALHSELARLLTRGITQIQDFMLNQSLVTVNSSRSQRQQLPLVSEQSPLAPSHSKIRALPECYGVCPVYKNHVGGPLNAWSHFSAKPLSPSLLPLPHSLGSSFSTIPPILLCLLFVCAQSIIRRLFIRTRAN